jgi:hypothetical protein
MLGAPVRAEEKRHIARLHPFIHDETTARRSQQRRSRKVQHRSDTGQHQQTHSPFFQAMQWPERSRGRRAHFSQPFSVTKFAKRLDRSRPP